MQCSAMQRLHRPLHYLQSKTSQLINFKLTAKFLYDITITSYAVFPHDQSYIPRYESAARSAPAHNLDSEAR